jgi:hypothetical protein
MYFGRSGGSGKWRRVEWDVRWRSGGRGFVLSICLFLFFGELLEGGNGGEMFYKCDVMDYCVQGLMGC